MPGVESERVGHRIRETYDDLCSLGNPCIVANITRTWSRRMIWPVARQLVALGLAWVESPVICTHTRLVMLPWSTARFPGALDIKYATTTVLVESCKVSVITDQPGLV